MTPSDLAAQLRRMLYGFRASLCVHAAAALGIADRLAQGPRTCADLAVQCEADVGALGRLLRTLVGLGIFREEPGGRFSLTPVGELLCEDAPGSLRAEVLNALHPTSAKPWGELLGSVRSGQASFPGLFGGEVWSYRAANPAAGAVFDAWASRNARCQTEALIGALDVTGVDLVVDVGGGSGNALAAILIAHPKLEGVLLDLERVLGAAQAVLREAGVLDRCRVLAGDFFRGIPSDGDLYLLKAVLHNWDDGAAAEILRNCRRAMRPAARIVVVESLFDPSDPWRDNFLDLHMLVMHGGRERTADQIGQLFAGAGLRLDTVTGTAAGISLLAGRTA